MAYTNKPPKWDAQGVEPTSDLQANGFTAGYKPPAPYFNYLFNRYTKSIEELQETAVQHTELINEDLNTLLTEGFYFAASGNATKNMPDGVEFYGLVVVKNSAVRYSQVLYSNTKTYVRWFNGGEWAAWGVYATNTDLDAIKSQIMGGTVAQANTLTSIELTNEDLNDIAPATATFYYAAGGNSVVNNPADTKAFGLMCYRSATGHRVQELYSQDGVKFIRHCTSDLNKEWTEWKALAFDADMKAALNKKGNVFYKLSDIGLTAGSETVEKIAEAMPVYTSLIINVGAGNNAAMYPNGYGVLFVTKLDTAGRVVFEYSVKSLAKKYYGYYDATYSTPWTGWKEFAFTDGTVEAAKSVELQYDKEIRYANKPAEPVNIAHGYQWADDTKQSLISGHKFFDGAGNLAPIYGSELYEGSTSLKNKYSGLGHTHDSITTVELTKEDLNDIKPDKATFYFAAGNNTVANNPAGDGNPFGMICYNSAYGHRTQEVITQDGLKYIRVFTTAWNAWKKVAYDEDIANTYATKASVSNVNNTSDMNKPVSTAQAAAIADAKAAGTSAQSNLTSHTGNTSNPHKVTKSQVGLGNVDNTADASKPVSTAQAIAIADAKKAGTDAQANLETHTGNKSNPHGVTKSQVGLGNVPNVATNDQTPTYTAASTLATLTSGEKLSVSMGKIMKAITDFISHIGNKSNPHGVTKSQVGLGNVDNTADTAKPVSTAQATAIADAKAAGTTAQSNLTSHTGNTSNPHGVTKSQVGLGNVPNVTTNNQTPTFSAASTRANITSGETLSVIFGKIYKFFADLKTVAFTGSYSDLSNKPTIPAAVAVKGNAESSYRTGNVNLTPANIGAAAAAHDHTSINSTKLTSEDLNNLKPAYTAFYYGAGGNTVTNKPAGVDPFGLMVYKSAEGHYTQELVASGVKYVRTYTTDWNDWRKVVYGSDVVDNLVSTATNLPLSAKQGSVLDGKISELNTKIKVIITNTGAVNTAVIIPYPDGFTKLTSTILSCVTVHILTDTDRVTAELTNTGIAITAKTSDYSNVRCIVTLLKIE